MIIGTWKTNGSGLRSGLHSAELPFLRHLWGFCSNFRSWMIWMQLFGNGLNDKRMHGSKVWHAKQGVFRKKLPPDVRDDPMKSPPWENESWLWGTTSRKSTVESWEAYRVRFTPFCFSPSSLDAFAFFWVGFWVLFCLFCVLKHPELLHKYCKLTLQQTRSLDDRLCVELDRQWRKKKIIGVVSGIQSKESLFFFCLLAAWLNENVVRAVALLKVCSLTECAVTRKPGVAVPIIVPTRARRQNREHAC